MRKISTLAIAIVLMAVTVSPCQVLTNPSIGEFSRLASQAEMNKCLEEVENSDACDDLRFFNSNYALHPAGTSYSADGGNASASGLKASSTLASQGKNNYDVENTQKNLRSVAWCEGVKGHGVGERINMSVTTQKIYGSPHIWGLTIVNGYAKDQTTWQNNSRVKKLRLYVNGKRWAELHLKDIIKPQTFTFPDNLNISMDELGKKAYDDDDRVKQVDLSLEILEVYPGSKFDDTCITGISFGAGGMDACCFAQGTRILMSNNTLKNIETIKSGDMVKSYDFESKKMVNSKVTKLVSITHSNLFKLKLAGNEIVTTDDHPFWIEKNVWAAIDADKANRNYVQKTKVEKLKTGDKIFIPEKNIFSEIIDIEKISGQQITYTIELTESDNFIANGMLVKTEVVK